MRMEDYIKEHRDQFDDQIFDETRGWSKLSKDLPPIKRSSYPVWKMAASFLILIVAGGLLYLNGYRQGQQSMDPEMASELVDIESYYGQRYAALKMEFTQNSDFDRNTKEEFLETLEVLEYESIRLKQRLKTDSNNEELISALVKNFKLQIQAMEHFLNPFPGDGHFNIDEDDYISL